MKLNLCYLTFGSFSCVVDQDGFLIQERFSRLPLKMDAPEKILCQAHAQPGAIADFLHENGNVYQHAASRGLQMLMHAKCVYESGK